jgi:hypothetical protein
VTIRRVITRTERTKLCGQEQGCKERKKENRRKNKNKDQSSIFMGRFSTSVTKTKFRLGRIRRLRYEQKGLQFSKLDGIQTDIDRYVTRKFVC